ncbi:MAG: hypothetical protein WBO37_03780 [Gammaproteobacteria bacterium]
MPEAIPADSVGLVTPQSMTFQDPLPERAATCRFSRDDDAARPGLSLTP